MRSARRPFLQARVQTSQCRAIFRSEAHASCQRRMLTKPLLLLCSCQPISPRRDYTLSCNCCHMSILIVYIISRAPRPAKTAGIESERLGKQDILLAETLTFDACSFCRPWSSRDHSGSLTSRLKRSSIEKRKLAEDKVTRTTHEVSKFRSEARVPPGSYRYRGAWRRHSSATQITITLHDLATQLSPLRDLPRGSRPAS